jgi:hypothetical protein
LTEFLFLSLFAQSPTPQEDMQSPLKNHHFSTDFSLGLKEGGSNKIADVANFGKRMQGDYKED